ncbi:hypothetical protein L0U85_09650 [Glycomyces sp. L485]|uniref:hypothetical protein n=1 Tax=Glycomyces sp. L485 TaxID=2909235 RepID=UPI001F4A0E9F|nr:hypothetical protein [Glycomyces sp. L485]MCH7231115.1 hypothetical protein [Glycomyces sp. L485]
MTEGRRVAVGVLVGIAIAATAACTSDDEPPSEGVPEPTDMSQWKMEMDGWETICSTLAYEAVTAQISEQNPEIQEDPSGLVGSKECVFSVEVECEDDSSMDSREATIAISLRPYRSDQLAALSYYDVPGSGHQEFFDDPPEQRPIGGWLDVWMDDTSSDSRGTDVRASGLADFYIIRLSLNAPNCLIPEDSRRSLESWMEEEYLPNVHENIEDRLART